MCQASYFSPVPSLSACYINTSVFQFGICILGQLWCIHFMYMSLVSASNTCTALAQFQIQIQISYTCIWNKFSAFIIVFSNIKQASNLLLPLHLTMCVCCLIFNKMTSGIVLVCKNLFTYCNSTSVLGAEIVIVFIFCVCFRVFIQSQHVAQYFTRLTLQLP